MPITIKNGVRLHVISTKKYKTLRIFVRFTTRLQKEVITKRALLTSVLETNSLHYPDQVQLSEQLAELYGASFGFGVGKKGNLHWVNVGMNVVNGKYVEDSAIFPAALDFLKEVLFYPNIKEGVFDEETFTLEKENMKAYLNSLKEDKQSYASLALQELYFTDEGQQIPSVGAVEDLETITSKSLASYYQQMMSEDQIDIFVVGDVEETEVEKLIKEILPFAARDGEAPAVYYEQAAQNIITERQVHEPVSQAKLNIGYLTNCYYEDSSRFALLVFNGLFGGFPHSKLFMNVREKESLAYYASSSLDTFRGFMSVQTGIDGKKRNQVLHLIAEQLESLRQGEITELEMSQTKAMLKNQFLLSLDSPQAAVETAYLDAWVPKSQITSDEWIERLEQVSIKDVQTIAKQIRLQAIFFLDGVKTDG